jgi:hypothetical protein
MGQVLIGSYLSVYIQWNFLLLRIATMIKLAKLYKRIGQKVSSFCFAPSKEQAQIMLFIVGITLLGLGVASGVLAQEGDGLSITYNDLRLSDSLNAILTYIEGTFGAMVMVAAGIGAILSSAFGQYRAALGLLVVAVGAFILRSLVSTFFNDLNVQE